MKSRNSLLLFTVFISAVLSSCVFSFPGPTIRGNGNVVKETRDVGGFDEVRASRGMNVYISQGETISVVVEADDNLTDEIETRVEGGVLEVRATANIRSATSKKVFVTVPEIKSIKGSSGSNVYSETKIVSDYLDLAASSGSNLKIEVETGNLEASTSSGSNITLSGTADNANCKSSSGSNIFGEELKAKNCEAKASSGSNIWITVETDLKGKASSGGNVFYFGEPSATDIEKSSGGNVIKK